MQKYLLPYAQTGYFSTTALDYIAQSTNMRPFYRHPLTIQAFEQVMADLTEKNHNRSALVTILEKQNQGFALPDVALQNIQLLLQPHTFTVVTGHQPCLFTGPLYFIYKIVSAINLARQLKQQYPDKNFVPVYWMGADDHDFEEINHAHIFGKTLTWQQPLRTATGRLSTQNIAPLIEELKTLVGTSQNATELIELFTQAYTRHSNLADATRYLVNQLFGHLGLVVINQDDAALKSLFAPIMEQELFTAPSYPLVEQTNNQLAKHGYANQAFARNINLFYLTDEYRERIERNPDNSGYNVINTGKHFTDAQIIAELQAHPERFSPNVILRPVYQQHVLPSVAYIGGSGELAYWLQLQSVFNHYNVSYPMLILRNSVLWIDEPVAGKMKALGISPQQLFTDVETLVTTFVTEHSKQQLNFNPQKQQMQQLFGQILQQATDIDPTLQASVLSETTKMSNSFDNLEAKILRAEKRKFDTSVQQIRNLNSRLFPNNSLQERYDNFTAYYLAHGTNFINTLLEHLNPMSPQFTILIAG